MAFFGEVGLSGEIRSVSQPLVRIKEAQALGFGTVLLPAGNLAALDRNELPDIECWGVKTVREALQRVF
jgi:DNA repair protein RadA/Sms